MNTERPSFVEDKHLEYLVTLRNSGVTNMFGAVPYLVEEFEEELTSREAKEVLLYWMNSFRD